MEQAVAQVRVDQHGCLVIDDQDIARQLSDIWNRMVDKPKDTHRKGICVIFDYTDCLEYGPDHPKPGRPENKVNSLCAC